MYRRNPMLDVIAALTLSAVLVIFLIVLIGAAALRPAARAYAYGIAAAWVCLMIGIAAWNAFGTLDLFAAILLGALSSPGTPIRLFTEGPGTVVMATLPWVMIPTILVPLWLLVHLTIARRMRAAPAHHPLALAT